jgi:hypothetical protein
MLKWIWYGTWRPWQTEDTLKNTWACFSRIDQLIHTKIRDNFSHILSPPRHRPAPPPTPPATGPIGRTLLLLAMEARGCDGGTRTCWIGERRGGGDSSRRKTTEVRAPLVARRDWRIWRQLGLRGLGWKQREDIPDRRILAYWRVWLALPKCVNRYKNDLPLMDGRDAL